MSIQEVADRLVAGCRSGQTMENLDLLYAEDAQSIEAFDGPGGRVTTGRDGIKAKHVWWDESFEVHGGDVSDPWINGDSFSVIFEMDVTEKATGERSQMKEVAIYQVKDDKIVSETFYYPTSASSGT